MYQLPATNSLVSCRNTTYSLVHYTLHQELKIYLQREESILLLCIPAGPLV